MYRRLLLFVCALAVIAGCAPRFSTFKNTAPATGFVQHRVNAGGNAVLESGAVAIDTILFERKLNGGMAAQVVGNQQFLIVPTFNKRIYFLNPSTGREITSLETESAVGSAAAVQNELIYFAEESGSDQVTCFNLVNGKKVWSLKVVDPPGPPIISGDELFITSRIGKVVCANRWTGVVQWEQDLHCHFYAPVAADSARVYVGTDRGDIVALSRSDGNELWRFAAGSTVFAQPLADQLIYVGTGAGTQWALDPASGSEIWRYDCVSSIHTTPVLRANRLIFGADDRVAYCLNAQDGGLLWRYETTGIIQSSPIIAGEMVILANSAGSIYQFNLDGQLLSQLSVKGTIQAPAAVIDGKVYVVTTQRRLYCLGH